MNTDAWALLAERSGSLVHHASLLMGALTHPAPDVDAAPYAGDDRVAVSARAALATEGVLSALAAAPELTAHQRTVQRFDAALHAWQRSIVDDSPLARRYQTALMQQAAQVLIACLHVEALAIGERTRLEASHFDAATRSSHGVS